MIHAALDHLALQSPGRDAGGDLSAPVLVSQLQRVGYRIVIARDYVFAFGSLQGGPNATSESAATNATSESAEISPTSAAFVDWNKKGAESLAAAARHRCLRSRIYVARWESVASPPALRRARSFLW